MREIKFRVWDKKLMHTVGNLYWCQGGLKWEGPGVGQGWCYLDPNFDWSYDIDRNDKPETVDVLMQWTRLKDCNGTDIYEGDVIETFDPIKLERGEEANYKGGVTWLPQSLAWGLANADDSFLELLCRAEMPEIIGNIYENPDLLNNKEESK